MRARDRAGFTLIEVLIAITMLAIVALGLMAASGRMIRTVSDDRVRTVASTAADARIAMIRAWPAYATLDSVYAGVETGQPLPGWTRTTTIVRTGGLGQPNDFKRATVVVAGPGLTAPVQRTVTIAAP